MTSKSFLTLLFSAIFVAMITVTIRSSLSMSLSDAWSDYAANPWAIATLWDAYLGFITFYVWVWWKERSLSRRMLWFVLIMSLGNIAMSTYVLIQIRSLSRDEPLHSILVIRRTA